MTSLLFRYGLKNDLVAALVPDETYLIRYDKLDGNYDILRYNCTDFPGYDFIANHINYKREAMEYIIQGAKYITIIRSPYTHVRSRFFFFGPHKSFSNASTDSEAFLAYLKWKNESYEQLGRATWGENSLSMRFGIYRQNPKVLRENFQKLDEELDLVMLTEYFDESLILLRKLMCWSFEDIVFYPQKVDRTPHPPITSEMRDFIDKLSMADIQMYDYFNKTFWEKVKSYGDGFGEDLVKFRSIKRDVTENCEMEPESDYCRLFHMDDLPITKVAYRRQMRWMCTD
ncbi:galactosylceramide sulfotransferase-like [Ptychodera flava]|uniref:galactosylceramide sulfotransferase-like n=1 Tax=Ptychodera flava TaxID=63121 RepID=UPI003969F3E1